MRFAKRRQPFLSTLAARTLLLLREQDAEPIVRRLVDRAPLSCDLAKVTQNVAPALLTILVRLANAVLKNDNTPQRRQAITALAAIGDTARPSLLKWAANSDENVVRFVAEARVSDVAAESLSRAILENANSTCHVHAVYVLQRIACRRRRQEVLTGLVAHVTETEQFWKVLAESVARSPKNCGSLRAILNSAIPPARTTALEQLAKLVASASDPDMHWFDLLYAMADLQVKMHITRRYVGSATRWSWLKNATIADCLQHGDAGYQARLLLLYLSNDVPVDASIVAQLDTWLRTMPLAIGACLAFDSPPALQLAKYVINKKMNLNAVDATGATLLHHLARADCLTGTRRVM